MIKTKCPSDELEEFKKNYQSRIENIASNKTEWLKDFVDLQKPKEKTLTVMDFQTKKDQKKLSIHNIFKK